MEDIEEQSPKDTKVKKKTEVVVQRRRKKNPRSVEERSYLGTATAKMLKLREAGFTWQEVAHELGIKESSAKDILSDYIKNIKSDTIETWDKIRSIEHRELAAIELFLWNTIETVDNPNDVIRIIDRLLKAKEIKYKLLGLNTVDQLEIIHKLPILSLSLPADSNINKNKVEEKVITIQDSSDELLGE